jgi:Zn-dependent peptidase ImmA (M78 family)/transcriptional regulator with XRE-family HTH domain
MPVGVKANIKPELLIWARTTAGFELREAAEAARIAVNRLEAWESGRALPSIPQLRKLSKVYKRPLAVFYLQEVPLAFQVLRDLRRLPGVGFRRLPPAVVQESRYAMQRRELLLDLLEDLDGRLTPFALRTNLDEDPESVGIQIRRALNITRDLQFSWREIAGRVAFNAWRHRIEKSGVLVFQATQIQSSDASGFAISTEVVPVIVVNRKDTPRRRTFSLLHELSHVMVRVSGVSDLETDERRPAEDQAIEVFCNRVAAAALMPSDWVLSEPSVIARGALSQGWEDDEISDLARSFGVSREALLRRLLQLNRTTEAFYRAKRDKYLAEFEARQRIEREKTAGQEIPRNIPQETLSNLGRPLISVVLDSYNQDKLTLSDVAGLLGVKTKHVPRIEQNMRREPA